MYWDSLSEHQIQLNHSSLEKQLEGTFESDLVHY